MKLTTALLLFCILQVSAKGFGQKKLNLKFTKTEISTILTSIEKQTTYRFLYNNDLADLKQKINLTVQEADLKEVLDQMFAKTGLSRKPADYASRLKRARYSANIFILGAWPAIAR